LKNVYPDGVISIVSDTYDYWGLITNILPKIKNIIMNRNGRLLIRGDSGDPVKIICGDKEGETSEEIKGTVELLWDIFGGHINSKGYKVLDSHIGAIYGDSITLDRCLEICQKLKEKGFAISNVVLGVGSYSFQYVTRDTFGFALKATHAEINNEDVFIFKDPKTDKDNFKKSQKGMCVVSKNKSGDFHCIDKLSFKDINNQDLYKINMLEDVFIDGQLIRNQSLTEIRNILHKGEF